MGTPVMVQEVESTSSTSGITGTLVGATAGNLAIAVGKILSTNTITLPSGWAHVSASPYNASTTRQIFMAYKKIAAGDISGGNAAYTFDDGAANSKYLEMYEVSGMDPTAPNASSAITPQGTAVTSLVTTTTGTLPQAKCFLVAVAEQAANNGGSTSVDSSYTLDTSATLLSTLVAHKITSATTAQAPTFSWLTARNAFGMEAVFIASPDVTTSPGTFGDTLTYSMNRCAKTLSGPGGTSGVPTLAAQGAANVWAGTTGLSLVGALNVKAGNTLPNYLALQGVLNQLAGTTGLAVDEAASRILA